MNVARAMFWPVLLSLVGATYFAWQSDPVRAVVFYSVVCTALYLLKQYRGVWALFANAPSNGVRIALLPGFLMSVLTTVFLPFLIPQLVVFYAVRNLIQSN